MICVLYNIFVLSIFKSDKTFLQGIKNWSNKIMKCLVKMVKWHTTGIFISFMWSFLMQVNGRLEYKCECKTIFFAQPWNWIMTDLAWMKLKTDQNRLATLTFLVQETLPQAEAEGHDQQGCHCSDWNQDGEGRSNYAGQGNTFKYTGNVTSLRGDE